MCSRTESSIAVVLLAWILAVVPFPSAALEPPTDAPLLRAKEVRHADLYIGNRYLAPSQLTEASTWAADLDRLGVPSQAAYLDARSGRWGSLMPKVPLLPGDGVGNELTWQSLAESVPGTYAEYQVVAWRAFTDYLRSQSNVLRIDVDELQSPGTVTVHGDGELIQIHAKRVIDGVPVRDSFLTAVISHGNLTLFGARNWGDFEISTQAGLTSASAQGVLASHLAPIDAQGAWRKPSLAIVPMSRGLDPAQVTPGDGLSHRLVWVLSPSITGHIGQWEALVDAHDGELLAFQDTANYVEETRDVVGGIFPVTNDGVGAEGTEQANYPMPFADVTVAGSGETLYTDAGGSLLACVDGAISSNLSGRYLRMIDTCGTVSEGTSGSVLDFGVLAPPSTDCDVAPGASVGNTHASRSGYYEINRMIEVGRSHLPANTWLQAQLPATMNVNANCNASGGPGGLNFFTSGGGCSNTGEIAGVFDHEWGHGMDGSDAAPGISSPGEGIADTFAALRLNTSCMGRNFRPGVVCTGFGDPCLTCTGVRDVDWAKRASGVPHDLAWIDANCGSGGGTPCGGSTHCEGAVYAEAIWDLWQRDLTAAPFNMGLDTSRELATQLTFEGGGLVGSWFSCVDGMGTGDGCNADGGYLNYLAADDDNGDLSDGTPHMTAIAAAFARHGIDCPTPTVQNSGCANRPTTAPSVTATPLDRGARITWTAVNNATHYRVYRTDGVHGCDFGKMIAGETTGLELIDSGLKNGREYSYIVIAIGGDGSCLGPASSCTTVTPTGGGNLAIAPASFTLTTSSGDLDPFIDNCETSRVCFDFTNVGTVPLTNIELTDVSVIDLGAFVTVTTPLPTVAAANLASCEQAQVCFEFVGDGLAQDDNLRFVVEINADQLADARTAIAGFELTESDLESVASRTFSFEADYEDWQVTSGAFSRTAGGPNGTFLDSTDNIDGSCDQVQSPKIRLSATSTLALETNFIIEPFSGGSWYDRANVALRDATTGARNAIDPDGGRAYNASGSGGGCLTGGQNGWAGTMSTWAGSSWSSGVLDDYAGQVVNLDIAYSTDGGLALRGFWFDEVTLTNFELQAADAQSNVCTVVGNAPVAIDDLASQQEPASAMVIDVLANDSDGDADPLTVTAVTQPQNGTVTINGGGPGNTVTFTPDVDFVSGRDSFQYAVSDGNNIASVATVVIDIGIFLDGFESGDASRWGSCRPVCP